MTQRIFDIENKKDMTDLWDVLLEEEVVRIVKQDYGPSLKYYGNNNNIISITDIIKINFHDKTEITRPIQEVTEQDIGKICAFWDKNNNRVFYGKLFKIDNRFSPHIYQANGSVAYIHCRRLTKQEIEELC